MSDPKMVVLHLSDLHFGCEGSDTARAQRDVALDGLLDSLAAVDADWKPSVICITGDVGWRGHPKDYEEAETWLLKLLEILGLTWADVVFCVGNHDLDRASAKYVARPSTATESDHLFEVPMNATMCQPFAAFSDLCKRAGVLPLTAGKTESWLFGTIAKGPLRFIVLNSAWFSRDDHDRGRLWLGLPLLDVLGAHGQFSSTKRDYSTVDIAMFHHPPDDLHPSETNAEPTRPDTFNYLEERVDIVLTGHQHQARLLEPLRRGDGAQRFESGASYADIGYKNSFRLLRIDSAARLVEVMGFAFDPSDRRWHKNDIKPYSLPARSVSEAPLSKIDSTGTWLLELDASTLSDEQRAELVKRLKAATGDVALEIVEGDHEE
jgi:hypothetical protein